MSENTSLHSTTFPEDLVTEALEVLTNTSDYKKGANEVTKAIERTRREDDRYQAVQLVLIAEDVDPPEVTFHLPDTCKEAGVPFVFVPSQDELGEAIGIKRAACVAVYDEGAFSRVISNASEIIGL